MEADTRLILRADEPQVALIVKALRFVAGLPAPAGFNAAEVRHAEVLADRIEVGVLDRQVER